jgi:hypothetical protein
MRLDMTIEMLDHALMSLYSHVNKNSRRLTHLVVALLPLLVLLVGSCKTTQLPLAYSGNAGPEQLRAALFPDQANFHGAHYYPAAGYVSQAQTFIAGQPQSLMMLTQQEIGYLFGKPTLHRQDADAEVWQYKAGGCVVDFYFYNQLNARDQSQLSYIDFRMKDELIPGSRARQNPISVREKSDCLHDVMSRGSFSIST